MKRGKPIKPTFRISVRNRIGWGMYGRVGYNLWAELGMRIRRTLKGGS